MFDFNPVIAIIGAGAVGGYYGGRLAQHRYNVHFLLRSDYEAVRQKGWAIKSCDGDFALPPQTLHVYNDPRQMPKADLVIITTKTTSNDQYESLIRPLLKDDTAILTFQNGLGNEERLAKLFGAERILGGLAFVCINRTEPGLIHHMDYGHIRIGEHLGLPSDRLDAIVNMFKSSAVRCEPLPSLKFGRWDKLTWNVPFSGLGTVLNLTTDHLVSNDPGLALTRAIIAEIVATARALGVNLPADTADIRIHQTQTMGTYKSSMQIDREMNRPMEVEAILGEPLRFAQRAGVSTPHLQMLYQLAKIAESALRPASLNP